MRYAAEALEPIGGTSVRRVAHEARRITSHLGELQDSAVCRAALMDLSQAASAAGEPTFTYGRLHALEQARAERLAAEYWTSQYLEALASRTAQAITAIAGR
jgi:CHAD domain-containing protein